jgi:hypothetical protein
MKDEELAEEYVQGIEGDDCVILTDREERKQAFIDGYHEGFKDCAKARLNVTTISDCPIKDEWHDLEKDPNDLPKHTNSVLGYCRGDYYDVCFFNGKRLIGHGESDFLKWKEIE